MIYGRIKLPLRFQDPGFIWNLASYPATLALPNNPGGTKGETFKLTKPFIDWVFANNSEQAARFLLGAQEGRIGWVNKLDSSGSPISESLTMWGNIVMLGDPLGQWYPVETIRPFDDPFSYSSPLFAHRFTVITRRGYMRNPGAGLVCTFPFVTAKPVFFHKDWVAVSDTMPTPIYPGTAFRNVLYRVIVDKGATVRTGIDGNQAESPPRREYAGEENVYGELMGWLEIGVKRWVLQSETRRVI